MAGISFACGTSFGGALDSTAALAAVATSAGTDVRVVVASSDPYETRRRTTSALVRITERIPPLGRAAWRGYERVFSGTTVERYGPAQVLRATDVPAAVARVHGSGGLIVANSVRRIDLERLIGTAHRRGARIAWYLRESSSLDFAGDLASAVDVLLANSRPLAAEAERITGRPCSYIPSVIQRAGLEEPEARTSILLVNPIASHGLDLALRLAALAPGRRFVLQESWLLDDEAFEDLRRRVASMPNVELRRKTTRDRVFIDARIMVAPHAAVAVGLNRPRVALESQFLGVPMVATAVPGLAAVAASPELLLPESAGAERWNEALDAVDADYEAYCREARRFAETELASAEALWQAFADECGVG